jgi:hypothetical protein
MDAYMMVEWESASASGHIIIPADMLKEEMARESRARRIVRVSTFFAEEGTDFDTVVERFDEHYNATFEESLDRIFGRLRLAT